MDETCHGAIGRDGYKMPTRCGTDCNTDVVNEYRRSLTGACWRRRALKSGG